MESWTLSLSGVVFFCGLISAVWGVWKIIKELKKPSTDLKIKMEEHERKLQRDKDRLDEIEEYQKVICKSLLSMVDHEITGNGIEKLKTTKTELQNFLIDR